MDTSDKGAILRSYLSDADVFGLASHTCVADIDIVAARGEICTG